MLSQDSPSSAFPQTENFSSSETPVCASPQLYTEPLQATLALGLKPDENHFWRLQTILRLPVALKAARSGATSREEELGFPGFTVGRQTRTTSTPPCPKSCFQRRHRPLNAPQRHADLQRLYGSCAFHTAAATRHFPSASSDRFIGFVK